MVEKDIRHRILEILYRNKEPHYKRVDLAATLGISPEALAPHLTALKREGLVGLTIGYAHISEKGADLLENR